MTHSKPLPLSARIAPSLARAERFRPAFERAEIEHRIARLPFSVSPEMVDTLTEFEAVIGGLRYAPRSFPPIPYGLVAVEDTFEVKIRKHTGQSFFRIGGVEAIPCYLDAADGTFYNDVWPSVSSYRVILESHALLDGLLDQQPGWYFANLGTFDPDDHSIGEYFQDECGIPVVPEVNESRLRCWRNEQVLIRRFHDPLAKADRIFGLATRELFAFHYFMPFFQEEYLSRPAGVAYDMPFQSWPAKPEKKRRRATSDPGLSIDLNSEFYSVAAGGISDLATAEIVATVKNSRGEPVSSKPVTFTATYWDSAPVPLWENNSAVTVRKTDSEGIVRLDIRSTNRVGVAYIIATTPDTNDSPVTSNLLPIKFEIPQVGVVMGDEIVDASGERRLPYSITVSYGNGVIENCPVNLAITSILISDADGQEQAVPQPETWATIDAPSGVTDDTGTYSCFILWHPQQALSPDMCRILVDVWQPNLVS